MDPLPTVHQADVGDLKDGGEKKQLSTQAGRRIPSQYTSSSHTTVKTSWNLRTREMRMCAKDHQVGGVTRGKGMLEERLSFGRKRLG